MKPRRTYYTIAPSNLRRISSAAQNTGCSKIRIANWCCGKHSSPTKRCKFLKESEDNAGELSIKHYTYRTNPYRSASVAFPFPMPLFLGPETELMIQRLRNDIAHSGFILFGFLSCRLEIWNCSLRPSMLCWEQLLFPHSIRSLSQQPSWEGVQSRIRRRERIFELVHEWSQMMAPR